THAARDRQDAFRDRSAALCCAQLIQQRTNTQQEQQQQHERTITPRARGVEVRCCCCCCSCCVFVFFSLGWDPAVGVVRGVTIAHTRTADRGARRGAGI